MLPAGLRLLDIGEDYVLALFRDEMSVEYVREYRVDGIATTLPFFDWVLRDSSFLNAEMDVGYIDRLWKGPAMSAAPSSLETEPGKAALAAAAVAAYRAKPKPRIQMGSGGSSPWKQAGLREQLWGRL